MKNKLKSLLYLFLFLLTFIVCEFLLHYIQTKIEIGTAAAVSLRAMEWMSAIGALIETAELVFGIEIKDKIKESEPSKKKVKDLSSEELKEYKRQYANEYNKKKRYK